jgi:hypothetical protein
VISGEGEAKDDVLGTFVFLRLDPSRGPSIISIPSTCLTACVCCLPLSAVSVCCLVCVCACCALQQGCAQEHCPRAHRVPCQHPCSPAQQDQQRWRQQEGQGESCYHGVGCHERCCGAMFMGCILSVHGDTQQHQRRGGVSSCQGLLLSTASDGTRRQGTVCADADSAWGTACRHVVQLQQQL